MSIEVKIGDPHVTIHHDYGVMISDPDGNIIDGTQKGLFFRDTRLVSRWHLAAQGQSWQLLNPGNQTFYAARIVLTNPRLRTLGGELDEHVVGLTISRSFGPGIHEDLDLHNHGMAQAQFDLELEVLSDFADVFEVKAQQTICRDGITTEWSEDAQRLTNTYHHDGFCRGLAVSIVNCASKAVLANGKLVFSINLKPDAHWHACLLYEFIDGDERLSAPQRCLDEIGTDEVARHLEKEKRKLPKLRSSAPEFDRLVHQAIDDMIALQLHVPGYKGQPLPSGGVPWFLSLFGRDSIIASLQFQIMDPDFSKGALERLGDLQAQSIDDFRDAEPGKIPHELRHGELAFLRKIPHTPYYGTADATPLYLILLHTTWKWTGNDALLRQHLATAERCLEWIDRYGDSDGDGF